MENITSFFFNIVPGALLILILETKSNFKIINKAFGIDLIGDLNFFWLIIFSVFIGFFLQAATKKTKEIFLYQIIFCKVKNEDPENFKKAEGYLKRKKLLLNIDTGEKRIKKIFFTMDNYISLGGGGRLLTHFASRLAYWSNLFWISLITIILALFRIIDDVMIIFSSTILLLITAYEAYTHLKNHYDILLKSFVSLVEIDKNKTKSR